MTARTAAGSVLRGTPASSHPIASTTPSASSGSIAWSRTRIVIRLAVLACMLWGLPHAANAQEGAGASAGAGASVVPTDSADISGFRYRNEITVDAGIVWQGYWHRQLFGPDRQLMDRRDWAAGFSYTHTFEDRVYDENRFLEVSQRMQPVSKVSIELRRVRRMAFEPDETMLEFGAAGKVSPGFALGGSIGLAQGERTVYFGGGDSTSGEKSFTWLFTGTAEIRVSRRVMLRESVSMGSYSHDLENGPDLDAGDVQGFEHELLWAVTPWISYSHILSYHKWKEYRSTTLFGNTLAFAVSPGVILKAGLRSENFKSEPLSNDLCIGATFALRIQPTPDTFLEGGYDVSGGGELVSERSQRSIFASAGMRF